MLTARQMAQLSEECRVYILVPRALDAQQAKPHEGLKGWERHQDSMRWIKRYCMHCCGIIKWWTKGLDGEEKVYGY